MKRLLYIVMLAVTGGLSSCEQDELLDPKLTSDLNLETTFADSARIAGWARGAVERSAALGLMSGNPDGTFAPDAPTTRAQAIAVLRRLMDHTAN